MTVEMVVGTPPRGGQRLRLLLHSRSGMAGLVVVCLLLIVAVAQAVGPAPGGTAVVGRMGSVACWPKRVRSTAPKVRSPRSWKGMTARS